LLGGVILGVVVDNYTEKSSYLYNKQSGLCIGCNKPLLNGEKIDFQHRAHNSDWRREKFPLFIDSLLNLALMHNSCNTTKHRSAGKISDFNAEKYERFLERHPIISDFVNNVRIAA
jgi:hypothetical protein